MSDSKFNQNYKPKAGMTMVELLVVMGVFGVLAGAVFVNLIRPVTTANLSGVVDKLATDIKSQQVLTMTGADDGQPHGIYFTDTSYTTFVGASYSPTNPTNKTELMPSPIRLTNITIPVNTLIFSSQSGEILNFTGSDYSLTVEHSQTSTDAAIKINRYGALDVQY